LENRSWKNSDYTGRRNNGKDEGVIVNREFIKTARK
jgi:hypothetical protein